MAINLGDINFGLGPDTSRLENARREVLRFGQVVNQAARDQSEGARQAEAALRRQEKALVGTLNQVLKLNDAVRKTGANPTYLNSTTRMFERLTSEMGHGRVSALQFQRSMEDVQTSIARTSRAIANHVEQQKRTDRAIAESNRQMKEQADYALRVDRMLQSATRQVSAYNAAVSRIKAPDHAKSSMTGLSASALSGFSAALSGGRLDPAQLQAAQQRFMNGMQAATNTLRSYGHETSKTVQALERLANISILLHGPLSGIATRFALVASLSEKVSLGTAAVVTGISAAAYAFVRLSQGAITSAKAYQKVERGLNAVNLTASMTQTEMGYLAEFADRAGAKFVDISGQFVRLKAAAKGTNLEGAKTREIFETIVMAGTTLGSTTDEVQGTLRALEQIMSKGTVQAEELRGQLGDRLPGAFGMMADALGVTTRKLADMMKQGKVTSESLLPFARELQKRLGLDLQGAIEGTIAAENRFSNAMTRMYHAFDETFKISEAYEGALNNLSNALDWVAKNMRGVGSTLGILAGVFVGAMTAMSGPMVIAGFVLLARTIGTVTSAVKALNVAVMANPIGGFAALLTKLGFAIAGAVLGWKTMEALMGDPSGAESMADAIRANEEALKGAAAGSAALRRELRGQIEIQRMAAAAALEEAEAQLAAAAAKLQAKRAEWQSSPLTQAGFGWLGAPGLRAAEAETRAAADAAMQADMNLMKLDEQLGKINEMMDRLGDDSGAGGDIGDDVSSGVNRINNALREAQQEIAATRKEYELLMLPAGQREFARMQHEVNLGIENFRDRLIEAKVPAAQVIALTNRYAESLGKLKEMEYQLEYFPNIFERLGDVLGKGLDSAMNSWIDSVFEGKDALQELKNVGREVVKSLIKEFATLAVLNPLKNILGLNGGTQLPAFNMFGGRGGGGGGGFFANLLGNLFGGGVGGGPIRPGFNLPGFAGGGSFKIGGKKSVSGVEDQLVAFYGKKGETVTVSKSGHSSGGGGYGAFSPTFIIQGNGTEEIRSLVEESMYSALDKYDQGSMARQARNNITGRYRRHVGIGR